MTGYPLKYFSYLYALVINLCIKTTLKKSSDVKIPLEHVHCTYRAMTWDIRV